MLVDVRRKGSYSLDVVAYASSRSTSTFSLRGFPLAAMTSWMSYRRESSRSLTMRRAFFSVSSSFLFSSYPEIHGQLEAGHR